MPRCSAGDGYVCHMPSQALAAGDCTIDAQMLLQIVIKKARNASEITELGTGKITEYASRGFRALGVARGSAEGSIKDVSWEAVGLLPLYDPPRHDTKETIERCIEKVGLSMHSLSQPGTYPPVQPSCTAGAIHVYCN